MCTKDPPKANAQWSRQRCFQRALRKQARRGWPAGVGWLDAAWWCFYRAGFVEKRRGVRWVCVLVFRVVREGGRREGERDAIPRTPTSVFRVTESLAKRDNLSRTASRFPTKSQAPTHALQKSEQPNRSTHRTPFTRAEQN